MSPWKALLFDIENSEHGGVSFSCVEIGINNNKIYMTGKPDTYFITESLRCAEARDPQIRKKYCHDKFFRELSCTDNPHLVKWDQFMIKFIDAAEMCDYNVISHSITNDMETIKTTNDLYGSDKDIFQNNPVYYPHNFGNNDEWNKVKFICSQMIIKNRCHKFLDKFIEYCVRRMTITGDAGSTVPLSLEKLTQFVRRKDSYLQKHTSYTDVMDLYEVLKIIFNMDGLGAYPHSNYYAMESRCLVGTH